MVGKTVTRITGSKLIADFVAKFGNDALPKRGLDGKLIMPDSNDHFSWDYDLEYALPEGTVEIVRVDHDDEERCCESCNGWFYTASMLSGDGTVLLSYDGFQDGVD